MQTIDIKHFRPDIRLEPNGRMVTLRRPYEVLVGPYRIEVPAGFMTDFASVPRFLWWLIPPWGLYSGPAIVHDYLYTYHSVPGAVADSICEIDRPTADRIFYKLMLYVGVSPLRARLMVTAVRIFGGFFWNKQGW